MKFAIVLALLCLSLGACGQKGALYLPAPAQPQPEATAPQSEPTAPKVEQPAADQPANPG